MRVVSLSEVAEFEFVWIDDLVAEWAPGYLYQVGQVLRPPVANGFFYEVESILGGSDLGMSSAEPPYFPLVEGAIVTSGSVNLVCRAPGNANLPTIDTVTYTVDPDMTVVANNIEQASRSTRFHVDGSSGGEVDDVHSVIAEITDSLGRDHVKKLQFRMVA